jgi:uncharacterized protein involved in type VI secretion and phage assembly
MTGLLDMLGPGDGGEAARIQGVVTGVVTNNQDPDGMGRVKVRFPWLSGSDESWWARQAVPMAAADAGTYFLPDVDDEVLVAFEHGDVRFPYVLGSLWHGGNPQAAPPEDNSDGKNAVRTIRSKSGLTITLDDSQGAERILIADDAGKTTIVVDAAASKIALEADADITVAAGGKLVLKGQGVEIESQAGIKLDAKANLDLSATGQASVKGAMVNLG